MKRSITQFTYSADQQNALTTVAQAIMRICIGIAAIIVAVSYQP